MLVNPLFSIECLKNALRLLKMFQELLVTVYMVIVNGFLRPLELLILVVSN